MEGSGGGYVCDVQGHTVEGLFIFSSAAAQSVEPIPVTSNIY